jgi:peroxiredoxin
VLFIGLAVWMMWGSAHGAAAPEGDDLQVGSTAPRFETLTDLNGRPLQVDFAASPVTVLNFWAPWCPSCREELPDLQAIWEKYEAQGLALLGITYDTDQAAVQAAVDSYSLTYPIVLDPDAALSMQYEVIGVPETYIVDSAGRITFIAIGAASYDDIEAAILESLNQAEAAAEGGS